MLRRMLRVPTELWNGMDAIFGWASLVSSRGGEGAMDIDELDRLEREGYRDIESGCYVRFSVYITSGFKPK